MYHLLQPSTHRQNKCLEYVQAFLLLKKKSNKKHIYSNNDATNLSLRQMAKTMLKQNLLKIFYNYVELKVK